MYIYILQCWVDPTVCEEKTTLSSVSFFHFFFFFFFSFIHSTAILRFRSFAVSSRYNITYKILKTKQTRQMLQTLVGRSAIRDLNWPHVMGEEILNLILLLFVRVCSTGCGHGHRVVCQQSLGGNPGQIR